MTASDAESISLRELLNMASPEEQEQFQEMSLGYTETYGALDLRETIASLYNKRKSAEVLCFAGASEGIFRRQHGHTRQGFPCDRGDTKLPIS